MYTKRGNLISLARLRVHFTDQFQGVGNILNRGTGAPGQLLQIAIRQHVEMIQHNGHHRIQQPAFTGLDTQAFGQIAGKHPFRLQPLYCVQHGLYLGLITPAGGGNVGQRATKPACWLKRFGKCIGDDPRARLENGQIDLTKNEFNKAFRAGFRKVGKRIPIGISRAAALLFTIIQ